jgi:hypothetical protein
VVWWQSGGRRSLGLIPGQWLGSAQGGGVNRPFPSEPRPSLVRFPACLPPSAPLQRGPSSHASLLSPWTSPSSMANPPPSGNISGTSQLSRVSLTSWNCRQRRRLQAQSPSEGHNPCRPCLCGASPRPLARRTLSPCWARKAIFRM